jgi:serine/threonine protein kinase
MPGANRCPACGGELPRGAVEELCPRCLLGEGLELGPLSTGAKDLLGRLHPNKAPWANRESSPKAEFDTAPGQSVLLTLADSIGAVPRVLLRETESSRPTPLVDPSSGELPARETAREHYQFLGEIARGGMGAVIKGRDTDLGRDLAVKVLLERHRDNPTLIRRFIEEAQIGGQLQHPGIVPVYELGCFDDRRPFFTMKLVKGHTLAALLAARPETAADRPRFLGIFEAVCQTVAYAHARGVIHRDLKPGNVMVGSFGEVQVVDWGLAKVLRSESVIDKDTPEAERETILQTARSGSETHASRAGSVLGTPEYMPPEQARGEIDAVDERADVFALGGILCEILTGHPPCSGRTPVEIHRKSTNGDMALAFERLAACGADVELVQVARRCLAPDARERPRDAGDLARAMTAYMAGVQDRLRAAELARAEAQARTIEERKRRTTQLRMAAAILLVLAAGIGGVAYQWNRAEASRKKAQARFDLAREAIERFYTGASEDVLLKEPHLKPLREKLLGSALEFYKKLRASLEAEKDEAPGAELAAAYERVADITGEIGTYPAAIEALAEAGVIRQRLADEQPSSATAQAALADVLETRSNCLAEIGRGTEALEALERARAIRQRLADSQPESAGNSTLLARTDVSLGMLLGGQLNRMPEAVEAVKRAAASYDRRLRLRPNNAQIARGLGESLFKLAQLEHVQGQIQQASECYNRAAAIYERLAASYPENRKLRENLGEVLANSANTATELGQFDEAERALRRALSIFEQLSRDQPNAARYQSQLGYIHQGIAWWLDKSDRTPEAVAEYRRALEFFDRLASGNPSTTDYVFLQGQTLNALGDKLRKLGRLDEAIETMTRAKDVLNRVADANPRAQQVQHFRAVSQIFTASLLKQMGRRREAIAASHQALETLEHLVQKTSEDIYNIACAHACLASLMAAGPAAAPSQLAQARQDLDLAMTALLRAVADGYRDGNSLRTDPDLDPLRSRPDFQQLMMDIVFPADPFAK